MKQWKWLPLLVRGLQLLLLVLALFAAVKLMPGKQLPRQEQPDFQASPSDADEKGKQNAQAEDDKMDEREAAGENQSDPINQSEGKKKKSTGKKKAPDRADGQGEPEETDETPPTIWLATDLHYQSPQMTDYQSAFDAYTMGNDGVVVPYLDAITDAFLEEVKAKQPSALILSGDLSQNGEKINHEELAKKLARVQEAGIPVLVVPGNHDINHPWAATYFEDRVSPAEGTSSEDFYQIYHQFGYDQASSRASDSLSYLYRLDRKYWLMMLDSCMCEPVHETGGKLSEETVAWMKTQLEEAKKQGVTVIPVSHHNLLDESTLYPEECTIENSQEVTGLLEEYGVPVYLSGHLHLQRIKKHVSKTAASDAYGIREIVTSPLSMSPCQYSVLEWQEDGSLSYHTQKIDIAGWAQRNGEEDENLLHFDAYADQFLVDVISDQAFKALQSASKDIKQRMAKLYADMNRDYCSGTKIPVSEIKKSEEYQYWIRYSGNDFWLARLQAILRDARTNNTRLELKAGVDFPKPGESKAVTEGEDGADSQIEAGSPAEEIRYNENRENQRGTASGPAR